MIEALCSHLCEKPGLYPDEMIIFLWDELQAMITASSIRRALIAIGWSKKRLHGNVLENRIADLRDYYLHTVPGFKPYHLVYVDDIPSSVHQLLALKDSSKANFALSASPEIGP